MDRSIRFDLPTLRDHFSCHDKPFPVKHAQKKQEGMKDEVHHLWNPD